jgi:predicted molibdopterin-dependent oxidoreductase YjgC
MIVYVDGRQVTGRDGQTIAGVMHGAGIVSWRRTRSGAPRGLFCGIGVCFDCLVTVNDEPAVRACQRKAADGDEVVTGE